MMFAFTEEMFDQADAIYGRLFRAATPIEADAEIASELFAKACSDYEVSLIDSGMTGSEIDDAVRAYRASGSVEDFIGFNVYETCNYKGEGEGYVLAMNNHHLPVFAD